MGFFKGFSDTQDRSGGLTPLAVKKKRPAEAGRRPGDAISGGAIYISYYYRLKCQAFLTLVFSTAYESRNNLH